MRVCVCVYEERKAVSRWTGQKGEPLMQMDRIIIPLCMKNVSVSVMASLIHSSDSSWLHHTAEREPSDSPLQRSVPRLPARLSTAMIA